MSNSEKVFYKYRPQHVHVHTYKQTISPKHYVKRKVYLKIKLLFTHPHVIPNSWMLSLGGIMQIFPYSDAD